MAKSNQEALRAKAAADEAIRLALFPPADPLTLDQAERHLAILEMKHATAVLNTRESGVVYSHDGE